MLAVLLLNRMTTRRRMTRKLKISKPVKEEPKRLEKADTVCCRTCLSTEALEPIFSSKGNEKKRSHELNLVTGLKIKMDDGLSQKICSNCIQTLKTALQFRRRSRKAEKTLLESVSTKRIKRKYNLRNKNVKTTKVKTKIEDDTDVAYNMFVEIGYDDFQNDATFDDDEQPETYQSDTVEENIKVEKNDEVKEKPRSGERKRIAIPNASSYKCAVCNKEFRLKATYKAHMRFHTNYCVCETCGKRCRNNNQLQEHKRARHGLGRIHKCAYCEYSSATKEALTIHERRHTGERPYVCDHCGATFHRRSNLVQHIAIHLPEKNFQCDLCPKRLKSKKFLQIHKHNAHTGKRYGYLCPVCDHSFEKPNKVRAHALRVHGLPDGQHGPIVRVQL